MGVVRFYEPTAADKKRYANMAVVIVTPCKDYEVPFKFTQAVVNLVAYSWLHGLKVYQMGGTQRTVVHWARNELARLARDHVNEYTGEKFTHVLWLDDDHVFNPDMLLWLARNQDKDVVSALYFGRAERNLPVVYVKDEGGDKYKHFALVEVPPDLCEVDAIGFGACLMRRDVLDRVPDPWFMFNSCGEDIYFCVHAKEADVKIWCDGAYKLGHIGEPAIVTEATYRQYMVDNQEKYADRIKVSLGGLRHG